MILTERFQALRPLIWSHLKPISSMLGKLCQGSGELSLECEHSLGIVVWHLEQVRVPQLVKSLRCNYDKLDLILSDVPARLDSSKQLVGTWRHFFLVPGSSVKIFCSLWLELHERNVAEEGERVLRLMVAVKLETLGLLSRTPWVCRMGITPFLLCFFLFFLYSNWKQTLPYSDR